jgi:ATPase components of ABC transporters with duplicated ATPase domains
MIQLDNICLSFGNQVIFDHVSCSFKEDQKIGLVGRNGSGKSTLLNVIGGTQKLDDGQVRMPKSCKIAFMPQDVVLVSDKSILLEALDAFQELRAVLEELSTLEEHVHHGTADTEMLERYTNLHHELHEASYESKQAKTKQMLAGLGFKQETFDTPVSSLSVGWKMRLVLAKLLLQQADFYLFDEPTNHLDLIAKDWFAEFLGNASFGYILVSHDKYFLDTVCQEICEISRGSLTCYTGNYDAYMVQKQAATELIEKKHAEQQKYIKKQTDTIERFRAKATKASMAQSMIKALAKIEVIELGSDQKAVRVNLPHTKPSGKIVLDVHNLSFSFDSKKIFQHASFEIPRGHKVALVAANGTGKTTLLNVIMNKYKATSGTVTLGYHVTPAFFEQDQNKSLNQRNNILDEVESICKTAEDRARVRGLLGAFLFSGEDVKKKIEVLSGGEKNRVAMVKILLQNANFLMLDEPTNHLDLISKDILLDALRQFDGTILFVSHDRTFLNGLATDILELTPDRTYSYSGNYDAYLYHKKHLEAPQTDEKHAKQQTAQKSDRQEQKPANKELYAQRKQVQQVESSIHKLEKELAAITAQFATLVYGTPSYKDTLNKMHMLEQKIKEQYATWEELLQPIE